MPDETKTGDGTGDGGTADRNAQIAAQVDAVIAKGDVRAYIVDLRSENYEFRDKIRDLKAKLPADGAVVLTGDDAKSWGKYQALGSPKDLADARTERDTFRAENQKYQRDASIREVAELTYKGKDKVLAKVLDGVEVEIIEVTGKDGKKTRVPHVNAAKEGDKPVPVVDFVEANHAEFLPALTGKPAETTNPTRPLNGPPVRRVFGTEKPPAAPGQNEYEAQRSTGRYSVV